MYNGSRSTPEKVFMGAKNTAFLREIKVRSVWTFSCMYDSGGRSVRVQEYRSAKRRRRSEIRKEISSEISEYFNNKEK